MLSQLIEDVRHLVSRLRDHERRADALVSSASRAHVEMLMMNEYQAEVEGWGAVARHQPRAALVHSIQQECKLIRQLEGENSELREVLGEQRAALDLIVFKYREHTRKLQLMQRLEVSTQRHVSGGSGQHAQHMQRLHDKLSEMSDVMSEAAHADETSETRVRELLAQLRAENVQLREKLGLVRGKADEPPQPSSTPRAPGTVMEKCVQADLTADTDEEGESTDCGEES